jgi:integrase
MPEEREKYGHAGEVSFSDEEWKLVMASVDNIEHELLLKFAVTTALRREDAVSVVIENINFDKLELLYYEKKKKRWRTIPLEKETLRLIKQYLKIVKRRKGRLFEFCGRTAYNILQIYTNKVGLGRRPFHAIRATCTKFCIKKGWTPEEVSRLTGDTVEVLRACYMFPNMSDMHDAMNKKGII